MAPVSAPDSVLAMVERARSLYERGLTTSTGGNLSHRIGDGFRISGTNTSFGRLRPEEFSLCDLAGAHLDGPRPSKEAPFHAAVYRRRPDVNAVLHLHSSAAIELGCLAEPTDDGNVLPVVTSGAITRVGRLPLLEYMTPGKPRLAERIEGACGTVNAILLQNHGVLAFAPTLDQAVDILEELEQNAGIWLRSGGRARLLDDHEMSYSTPLHGAAIAPGQQRPRLRP